MIPRNCSTRPARTAATWLSMLVLGSTAAHAFISEPETLVYGRILNRKNPNLEQLVTQGKSRADIETVVREARSASGG